jgi:hypothetical protein
MTTTIADMALMAVTIGTTSTALASLLFIALRF